LRWCPFLRRLGANPGHALANISAKEGREIREEANNGVDATVLAETKTVWKRAPLVLARISGEASLDMDQFVLAHGHIDSWYTGVADNATGDAILLEFAGVLDLQSEYLHRNVWVAWWSRHWNGRSAGSTWFVDEFGTELADRCVPVSISIHRVSRTKRATTSA